MRAVEITLTSTDDKPTTGIVRVERLHGDIWVPESDEAVDTTQGPVQRKVILEDNMRVNVFAMSAETEIVYDREQGAAMQRHAYETRHERRVPPQHHHHPAPTTADHAHAVEASRQAAAQPNAQSASTTTKPAAPATNAAANAATSNAQASNATSPQTTGGKT